MYHVHINSIELFIFYILHILLYETPFPQMCSNFTRDLTTKLRNANKSQINQFFTLNGRKIKYYGNQNSCR